MTCQESPQYQHYVPQLTLRKYSDYKDSDIQKPARAKQQAKVKCLDLGFGFSQAKTIQHRVKDVFGVPDMYCDTTATAKKRQRIEDSLGELEQRVARILQRIESDFSRGKPCTKLPRQDKDELRRFLFIMHYRNKTLHSRFAKSKEDYDAPDRAEMLSYMETKGYQTPKDVWLANIEAFMNIRLGHDTARWFDELRSKTDPEGARWFHKHLTSTFMSFCTPSERDSEFVLTQNAYGVFEGPNGTVWTDWHTFAPINPRLLIILRQNILQPFDSASPPINAELRASMKFYLDVLVSQHQQPDQATSWLHDLTVERPKPSYKHIIQSSVGQQKINLSADDEFEFTFSSISERHMQIVNTIFLETTQMIVYKSETGLRRALEAYFKETQLGFKICYTNLKRFEYPTGLHFRRGEPHLTATAVLPESQREAYLLALERIAAGLGSDVKARYVKSAPQVIEILPPTAT